jgi:metallo-beta-lactamase family protein
VPTFAVGRAQALLFHLADMFDEGVIAPFPIFLDSPMAIQATQMTAKHPELFDEETRAIADRKRFLRHLESLKYCVTADDSRRLND